MLELAPEGFEGFRPVHALDDDPRAVEATLANARANGVEVEAAFADVLTVELPETATAVANIASAAVEALATRVPADVFVTSGYLVAERPRLDRFEHVRRCAAEGWATDVWRAGAK